MDEVEVQCDVICKVIVFKKYEFDVYGVEMNQCYKFDVIVIDGQFELVFDCDWELYYYVIIWFGVWILYCWVFDYDFGNKYLIFDLCGGGKFIVFIVIGGEVWEDVVKIVGDEFGLDIVVYVIGLCCKYVDYIGDWVCVNEIIDCGCVFVCLDQYVVWCLEGMVVDFVGELCWVLKFIFVK